MKITHTPQCCERMPSQSFEHEYQAIDALLNHIIRCHPPLYAKLKKAGRRQAQGCNGCGYYDSGKPSNDGWHNAQPTFRRAWIMKALEHHIMWPEEPIR